LPISNTTWPTIRAGFHARQRAGDIGCDYKFIDEKGMNKAPFYAELLAQMDLRYFLSGVLVATPEDYACISVQRTSKLGHVQQNEIGLMERLLPHVKQHSTSAGRLSVAPVQLPAKLHANMTTRPRRKQRHAVGSNRTRARTTFLASLAPLSVAPRRSCFTWGKRRSIRPISFCWTCPSLDVRLDADAGIVSAWPRATGQEVSKVHLRQQFGVERRLVHAFSSMNL